jgi:hypothetical protein
VLDGRTPDQATVTIPARGSQTFSVNARDPEGQPLNYRWLVNGVERSGSGANFSYQPTAPEAGTRTVVCLVSDESHVDALQVQWTVEVQNRIEHPALGTLTWLGPNLFAHPGFGLIAFGNNGENLGVAWSFGLRTWLWIGADGSVFSTEYGELEVGADPEWLITSYFGYCYFNPLDELDGWVWTERFGWMRFEHTGSGAYLWVPKLLGWMAVLPGGDFYSFDYRSLDPQSLKNYVSQLFGPVTVGDPEGWIFSNHYGWIWGARGTNGKWFYTTQFGWVGVSDDGSNLWSVQQARWLK